MRISGRHDMAMSLVTSVECPSTRITSPMLPGTSLRTLARLRASFLAGITRLTVGRIEVRWPMVWRGAEAVAAPWVASENPFVVRGIEATSEASPRSYSAGTEGITGRRPG